jgi:uncharacterized protein YqjF (DUF2071 family)
MALDAIFQQIDHRPWPLPNTPWRMAQSWCDLLFAHWSLPAAQIEPLLPANLKLDTFDGMAWIGVVPFRMVDVRPRGLPSVPWLSAFPELNVRTYVRSPNPDQPKPGVFFFSLEAANPVAVALARSFFRLPYFYADMTCQPEDDWIHYRSRRIHRGAPPAEFVGRYRPTGEVFSAKAGTLEQWLTERYSLYTNDPQGRLYIGEIHHLPWPLQPAEAEIERNSMAQASGIHLPDQPPLLHFARRLDVAVWPLRRVTGGSS